MARRRRKGTAWLTARRAFDSAARERFGPDVRFEVGWASAIGDGLYRTIYSAVISPESDERIPEFQAVAAVPRSDAPPTTFDAVPREVELLKLIAAQSTSFRTPAWAHAAEIDGKMILVREFVPGPPLDWFSKGRDDFPAWEIIGSLAAEVHRLPSALFTSTVRDHGTQRSHVESLLTELSDIDDESVAADAVAWIRGHLPPEEPAVLLHGDLLGQNILFDPDRPPALIDWEYACLGDPAYDLAIVTRGVRKPFKRGNGLDLLLDAYNAGADTGLTPARVHVHEILIVLNWLRESLRGDSQHPPSTERQRLAGLLRRVGA
jgi:aminoglycoside phosphotransferase